MEKKRYAHIGIGGRARIYYEAIATTYKDTSELVAFCDINQTRMDYANSVLEDTYGYHKVPTYTPDQFEQMIEETKPDTVIVTSIDRTHHRYIIKAMECGCDVISEKPMTMDADKCQAILDCIERTGKKLRVTFNYRYSAHATKLRELLMSGVIGDVKQVHFEWLLNTAHGADYFRRWHRDKKISGGLLVHKATHHFDLINFWLGAYPKSVYAMGDLKFYGRENAEERGITKFYSRVHGQKNAEGDPFALVMEGNELLENLYLKAEKDDGYLRDQSVFGDNISIEDTMNVLVRYNTGAQMSYSLNAFSPWEGFRVSFTGTKGRIELEVVEVIYINGKDESAKEGVVKGRKLVVYPMFDNAYEVEIPKAEGAHGGGDQALLNDIFGDPGEDPFKRAATHVDGALSILTGIAANKSIATGLPVDVMSLVEIPGFKKR
jgi:predicted dehydrogenase